MIVDASVLLRAFFPDEQQVQAQALIRDHVTGRVRLVAPTLMLYEMTNAVVQAVRRGCITDEEGEDILTAFDGLAGAPLRPLCLRCRLPGTGKSAGGDVGHRRPAAVQRRSRPPGLGAVDRERLTLYPVLQWQRS